MIHRTKIKYPILFAYSVNSCNNYIYIYISLIFFHVQLLHFLIIENTTDL